MTVVLDMLDPLVIKEQMVKMMSKKEEQKETSEMWNSLAVQWLELRTFLAVGPGSVPGQGTKILQAAWYGQRRGEKNSEMKNRTGLVLTWS